MNMQWRRVRKDSPFLLLLYVCFYTDVAKLSTGIVLYIETVKVSQFFKFKFYEKLRRQQDDVSNGR